MDPFFYSCLHNTAVFIYNVVVKCTIIFFGENASDFIFGNYLHANVYI